MRGALRILIGTILLLILGCAATAKPPVTITAPCPAPPATSRPHLPLADLKADSSSDTVMRAYQASVEALAGYASQLEQLLEPYQRSPPDGR